MGALARRKASPTQAPIHLLQLTVLKRLDGLLQGDHAGLLPGHGSDTGEARPYVPGDDPRRIDWAVTARTGDTHVRDTIADHELELWLVADTSSSLRFGTSDHDKQEVAWAAAGAFALLASRGGNRVAAITAGGKRAIFPARSGRAHVGAVLAGLRRPGSDGDRDDLAHALKSVRRLAPRRGMVVVVSDFLEPEGWERPLRLLTAHHDVVAVEVQDQRELDLPDVGLLAVVDPETGRRRYVDTHRRGLRERYAAAATAQRADIARRIVATGADHLVLRTDRDWVVDLVRFVGSRKARRLAAGGRSR
jgi:uncharacterized protein (DUF58 family)